MLDHEVAELVKSFGSDKHHFESLDFRYGQPKFHV